jgi:6-pyruvoyltetrahydropterin/6-carboxytetrahydropterin synthase
MVYLTREEHFSAAHRLSIDEWSAEKNKAVFGKCANQNFHGHNFLIKVTVKGEPDPQTGFAMNVTDLSDIMKEKIIERFDHKNLNVDVPDFLNRQPTCENLCIVIWELLEEEIVSNTNALLHQVRVYETPRMYVDYYGKEGVFK